MPPFFRLPFPGIPRLKAVAPSQNHTSRLPPRPCFPTSTGSNREGFIQCPRLRGDQARGGQ
ncbi:hypothetical protein OG21DRAFT_1510286 [Imleria badia]|nr:hypothetical protein OG21DRAFT_1510286 [Imleria badia]